jgi:hypothetical protein
LQEAPLFVKARFTFLALLMFFTVLVKAGIAAARADILCSTETSPTITTDGGSIIVGGLSINEFGASCGGGGTIAQFPGQSAPLLLDRLTLNPSLALQNPLASSQRARASYAEVEKATDEDREIQKKALLLVRDWHEQLRHNPSTSTILMEMVYWQIAGTPLIRTGHTFNTIPRYILSKELTRKNPTLTTVVLFIPRKGVIISSPVWDTLATETKVGLLIHESLRQLQLYYFLTDEQLQLLTAMLVDIKPNATTRFDAVFPPLLKTIAEASLNSPGAAQATLLVFKGVNQAQFAEMNTLLQGSGSASALDDLLKAWKKMGLLAD